MPIRKNHARKNRLFVSDDWRKRIQTSMIINRLVNHVKGEVELTPTQVTAALGLLKKTAPDLQSVAMGQDPELEPIQTVVRPAISREDWLKLHGLLK